MTVVKIGQYLVARKPEVTAAIVLCRPSGWVLVVLALLFFINSLLAEQLRRRTLLAVFERAPNGTMISLKPALGACGIQVTMGSGPRTLPERAECEPTAESD